MRYQRLAAAALAVLALAACSPASRDDASADGGVTTVTFRLWDDQVAAAYEESFAEFTRQNPDVRVEFEQVAFDGYGTRLPLDVSSGTAPDVYWVNSSDFGALADAGRLIDVGTELADAVPGWEPAAVEQYSRGGSLWGVPVVTDGRTALFYNRAMVEAAGIDPANLTWSPTDPAADTLRPALLALTRDDAGRTAADPGFDPGRIVQYGYNAARDTQAIIYPFLGSNGGVLQNPDESIGFASPQGEQSFSYLVDLINNARVAPSAADTNSNPDFSRDQFLQGRMALFQSGVYNLKNVDDGAQFEWAVAPLPAGPTGRVSVVNSVIAAGNADSPRRDAALRVLRWIGSEQGAAFVGASGAALPAVTAAQQTYYDYWNGRGVDISNFGDAAGEATVSAPVGANFGAATTAFTPILNEVFAGRTPVAEGLRAAQEAGDAALGG